ncbi:putative uncharacterized protein C8orf44 [Plecturocebus cupreus]
MYLSEVTQSVSGRVAVGAAAVVSSAAASQISDSGGHPDPSSSSDSGRVDVVLPPLPRPSSRPPRTRGLDGWQIPALWEANAGRSPEVRSSRPAWPIWQNPNSIKSTKISRVWWQAPVIPDTQEAEAGESFDPGRWKLHTLGGQGSGSPEVRSLKPAWSTWQNPISTKNTKISQAWWYAPVIPAIWEAEARELFEPGSTLGGQGGQNTKSRDQDHGGQHGKTPSLIKIQKLAGHGGMHLQSQLLGRLRQENRLNGAVGGGGGGVEVAHLGRPRQDDCLRTGVQDQPEQHSEILSLQKIKLAKPDREIPGGEATRVAGATLLASAALLPVLSAALPGAECAGRTGTGSLVPSPQGKQQSEVLRTESSTAGAANPGRSGSVGNGRPPKEN